jgi:RNA recognition motif-containing protein
LFFIFIFNQLFVMNIYVSNLSFNVTDEDLQDYFAEYGEVSSAKVIMDKFTGKSRGFAFVEMADDEAAKKAIAELDGASVDGRTIGVSVAKPREDRGNGGGGGGNRGGGGGGFQRRGNSNYSNSRY